LQVGLERRAIKIYFVALCLLVASGCGGSTGALVPQQTNLVTDPSGALYGTTPSGGTKTCSSDGAAGCGVVLKIVP
jgi:hypothetical protein